MSFPFVRGRRLRTSAAVRAMVTETHLSPSDFIAPLFVMEGEGIKEEIKGMPGYYRYSIDLLLEEVKEIYALGISSALLFAKAADDKKDNAGTEAFNPDGLMQRTARAIKSSTPEICLMTDVALDPYSSYGHDGIVKGEEIDNDSTNEVLAKMSVSHAQAGADFVAPSDMMDGRIGKIREALEKEGYVNTGIMAYSAKYASCFYGPFRNALDSAPGFGDKKTYQMNPTNSREAIHEILLDVEEGADIVMVKPAVAYLDIIKLAQQNVNVPISAYHVSGEYAMIKAAAEKGWVNEEEAMLETLIGIKRAGADLIATYYAKTAAEYLRGK